MTTWTTISNAAVAVGAIPSSSIVTALRDNPSAVAESSSGAPVMVSGWHPVDKISTGDFDVPEFRDSGKDEVAVLGGAFNRMRRSLDKAMKMIEQGD